MKVTDGQLQQQIVHQKHEDRLYVCTESDPDYLAAIARANAKLRIERPHKSHVRLHLQMTPRQYQTITERHPEVLRGSSDERRRAWERIAKLYPHIVGKQLEGKYHAGKTLQRKHHGNAADS